MEDALKLIVPLFNSEQNSGDPIKGFELIAEEPEKNVVTESADKKKIAFTLNVENYRYNFEILKEDLETVLKFF